MATGTTGNKNGMLVHQFGPERVRSAPIWENGTIWRQELALSLTTDHRIADGYQGALFLQDLSSRLERPAVLI